MNLNIDTGPNSLDYMRVGVNTETIMTTLLNS